MSYDYEPKGGPFGFIVAAMLGRPMRKGFNGFVDHLERAAQARTTASAAHELGARNGCESKAEREPVGLVVGSNGHQADGRLLYGLQILRRDCRTTKESTRATRRKGSSMNMATKKAAMGTAMVLMFGLAACGSDGDASGRGGASVSVVLTDGDVRPNPTSTGAGSVEIVARNEGQDLHDLVVVKGDDPAALPVNEDGAVLEDGLAEGDFIGRIAVVDAGTEESASFDLEAGSYILFCNIVIPTAVPPLPRSHFQDGMVSTFTVT